MPDRLMNEWHFGKMAERFKALVLKTRGAQVSEGSNPSLSLYRDRPIGRTTVFGAVNLGSSPSPCAGVKCRFFRCSSIG